MTIKELIEKLQRHPPEKDIAVIISRGNKITSIVGEIFDTREFEEGVLINCKRP